MKLLVKSDSESHSHSYSYPPLLLPLELLNRHYTGTRFLLIWLWTPLFFVLSSIGSIILAITYGFKAQEKDDPNIRDAELAVVPFNVGTQPGAFLVDIIPACKSLFFGLFWPLFGGLVMPIHMLLIQCDMYHPGFLARLGNVWLRSGLKICVGQKTILLMSLKRIWSVQFQTI